MKFKTCLFLFFMLCQAHHTAWAQTLFISSIEYPPLVNDNQRGIVVDIANEALSRAGYKSSIEIYPWARALSLATHGRSDGIFPVFKTPEREEALVFHMTPLMTIDMVLFQKADDTDNFDGSISSIKGKKVVFINGTNLTPDFDKAKSDGRLIAIFANNIEQQIKMVNAGRADYAVAERYAGLQTLHDLEISPFIQAAKVPITSRPVFLGLNRNAKAVQISQKIDNALKSMKADSTFNKIIEQYVGSITN